MTEELFDRYTHNLCSNDERIAVEEWLEKCTDTELIVLLQPRWELVNESMPDLLSDRLLQTLSEKIQIQTTGSIRKIHPFSLKRNWVAAASIIVLLVSGYAVFFKYKRFAEPAKQQEIVSASLPVVTWITSKNELAGNKTILLKDGSRVVLYPFSVIQYAVDFNSNHRDIYLKGKADFTIAKNKKIPFTVFSGDIGTTAVGTRFRVIHDLGTGVVSVKLFEGIVKIRSVKNTISGWENDKQLYAGEEVRFENGIAIATLWKKSTIEKKNTDNTLSNGISGDEISFSNTPLSEVFEQMEKMYCIRISYVKTEISGMNLTTTINKHDSPSSILDAIVQMNALAYYKNEIGYCIIKNTDTKK